MRIAFLNNKIYSELAAKYLVDKYSFKSYSITDLINQLKTIYFKNSKDKSITTSLRKSIDHLDKSLLIKTILNDINSDDSENIVIDDITTPTDYYSVLVEDFVPIKLLSDDKSYDPFLDLLQIIKLKIEDDLSTFYESLDLVVANYDAIQANRTKGGIIQNIDEEQQEDN